MVIASAWVGFTLPGMIELPGSFSGSAISPIPERGPDASRRTSLAILLSAPASVFSAPCANSSASWPASAANLFGAGLERQAGHARHLRRHARAELRVRVQAGADRGAADGEAVKAGHRGLKRLARLLELRHIAGEFLPQRERRCVLQVRAADLDDGRERIAFGGERVREPLQRRDQPGAQRARRPRCASRWETHRSRTGRG
jgi:hypothetical protein